MKLAFNVLLGMSSITSLFSSVALDEQYSYKNMIAVVMNSDSEPVHGEHVENEMLSLLKTEMRFEFSEQSQAFVKERLNSLKIPKSDVVHKNFDFMNPLLEQMATFSNKAAIFVWLKRGLENKYEIEFHLLTLPQLEEMQTVLIKVENTERLEGFSAATRKGLETLLKSIPYEASVIQRDGYRIVIDRGLPFLKHGMQIPTYTLELRGGKVEFEETGTIKITQVEPNISFGTVVVEKRPREVMQGNKIRLSDLKSNPPILPPSTRSISSIENTNSTSSNLSGSSEVKISGQEFEVTKGRLGRIDLNFNNAFVQYKNQTAADSRINEMSRLYPGVALDAELWLTSRVFAELGLKYATLRTSSLSDFSFVFGYRLNISAPERGPMISVKLGYSQQGYSFETPNTTTATRAKLFTDGSYSGVVVGGGLLFPIMEKWSAGLDLQTLLFPGLSEGDVTSGSSSGNVFSWMFGLRGVYSYSKEFDIEGKVFLQNSGATFTGNGTKTRDLAFTKQTTQALTVGAVYYF